MSITFTPYHRDAQSGTWLLPEPCRTDSDAYSLNLANGNALDVLERLGFPDQSVCDAPIPLDQFIERTVSVLRQSVGKPSPALETTSTRADCGPVIINCGRDAGYIERRIREIGILARRAREIGATHIGWG